MGVGLGKRGNSPTCLKSGWKSCPGTRIQVNVVPKARSVGLSRNIAGWRKSLGNRRVGDDLGLPREIIGFQRKQNKAFPAQSPHQNLCKPCAVIFALWNVSCPYSCAWVLIAATVQVCPLFPLRSFYKAQALHLEPFITQGG